MNETEGQLRSIPPLVLGFLPCLLTGQVCIPNALVPSISNSVLVFPPFIPSAILVGVLDDCGSPVNTGSVIVSFSTGDPPVALVPIGDGRWTGTFSPEHPQIAASVVVQAVSQGLHGTLERQFITSALQLSQSGFVVYLNEIGALKSTLSLGLTAIGGPLNYTTTVTSTSGTSPAWLTVPQLPGSPPEVAIDIDATGLGAGTYYGLVRVDCGLQNCPRYATIVLNVAAADTNQAMHHTATEPTVNSKSYPAQTSCVTSQFYPTITVLDGGFAPSVSWPAGIQVSVIDNCNQPMSSSGIVTVNFDNGDAPFTLGAQGAGVWSGTWAPQFQTVRCNITATAVLPEGLTAIQGTASISSTVTTAPAPFISAGGIVNAASYGGGALAPGEIVAAFGQQLAVGSVGASSLPLADQLENASLVIGPYELPLLFVTSQVVGAIAPFELVSQSAYAVVAENRNQISVPFDVTITPASPGVFTEDSSGGGQGVVYRLTNASAALADASNPAHAGNLLLVYCTGLGAVNANVTDGAAAPLNQTIQTVGTVTATIGGVPATVQFAGLAPGLAAGLYQVNITVPAGIAAGNQVPLVLTVVAPNTQPVNSAPVFVAIQ